MPPNRKAAALTVWPTWVAVRVAVAPKTPKAETICRVCVLASVAERFDPSPKSLEKSELNDVVDDVTECEPAAGKAPAPVLRYSKGLPLLAARVVPIVGGEVDAVRRRRDRHRHRAGCCKRLGALGGGECRCRTAGRRHQSRQRIPG
jgi:hypothetical protein